MKSKFLSVLLFLTLSASSQNNMIDVLHYQFHIKLNDENDTIYGVAVIKVKFLQPSDRVSFDLGFLNDKGRGMQVGKMADSVVRGIMKKEDKITVFFFKNFNTGDTTSVVIPYHGIPADGLIISNTKYGRRSFFADNWPDRGRYWLPCNDNPADKAAVEFIVTAPDHYQVVANGMQVEETSSGNGNKRTHWKEEIPVSTKVMTIGVAEFAVKLAGVVNDCIPVYSWVYPEDKDKGFYDYALAKDILPFYINNIGPYGYKKLANVQSRTRFGGLENANTIFYSENSVTGTRTNEGLLAHEIAHQWFGNMATEKNFGHLWLSEGFATYFTILYFESKYGKDTAIGMLKQDREEVIAFSKTSNRSVVDTTETDYMELLNANSYQKGGWTLHMLRRELGDSVFWKSIRKYYSTYAGSIAGTEDLQKVFENVSGKDLNRFFYQWLYTAGQPDLNIEWNYLEKEKAIIINIIQKQKVLFHFPLEVQLKLLSGKTMNHRLQITGKNESFKIPVPEKPSGLAADPETSLLFNTREMQ